MVALTLYTFLKFLHVLLAIIAVGFNASYGIWLTRAAREPEHELHVVRTIKFIDDRIATPAYGLLLVTGISMVLVGNLSFGTLWLALALGLYGLLIVVALTVYTPTLRRQVDLLGTAGHAADEYRRLAQRGKFVGIFLGVIVIAIVFLMVAKPT